jgi:hypothetical protein
MLRIEANILTSCVPEVVTLCVSPCSCSHALKHVPPFGIIVSEKLYRTRERKKQTKEWRSRLETRPTTEDQSNLWGHRTFCASARSPHYSGPMSTFGGNARYFGCLALCLAGYGAQGRGQRGLVARFYLSKSIRHARCSGGHAAVLQRRGLPMITSGSNRP